MCVCSEGEYSACKRFVHSSLRLEEFTRLTHADWTQTRFIMTATQIAARLSARVFLGERLCRNSDWIEISIRFSIVMMRAQDALRS